MNTYELDLMIPQSIVRDAAIFSDAHVLSPKFPLQNLNKLALVRETATDLIDRNFLRLVDLCGPKRCDSETLWKIYDRFSDRVHAERERLREENLERIAHRKRVYDVYGNLTVDELIEDLPQTA